MNLISLLPVLVCLGMVVLLHFLSHRNAPRLHPVIAGKVTEEVVLPNERKYQRLSNAFMTTDEVRTFGPGDFSLIGYLVGNSLKSFGLPEDTIIFCEDVTVEEIKKGDIVVLKVDEEPNKGKLKARVCLGLWGSEDEADDDLKRIAKYDGTVKTYFEVESPKRWNVPVYDKHIKGHLKTLSSMDNGIKRISRPHNPNSVQARVKYMIKSPHTFQW